MTIQEIKLKKKKQNIFTSSPFDEDKKTVGHNKYQKQKAPLS